MTARRRLPLGAALLMAAAAALSAAPSSARAEQSFRAPHEYVTPDKQRSTARPKKQQGKRDPDKAKKSQRWQVDKHGNAIDGRGDFRSAKRLRRQLLCRHFDVHTGRQWKKLRRAIHRAQREQRAQRRAAA